MINFQLLDIEGFGSIAKPFKYWLNQQGINILSAPNEIGKTTIFSAWYWCLFGKTLKSKSSISTWKDKRPKGWQGTKVENYFHKGGIDYSIIRCEGYKGKIHEAKGGNRLILIENGKERNDLRDKKDTQREIEKILGFSPELFKNSVIFGQKMKRIIEEDGPTKKKVFEEIFETEYLQKAKENQEEIKRKLDTEISEINNQITIQENRVSDLKKDKKRLKSILTDFDLEKQKRLDDKKDLIAKCDKNISHYEKEMVKYKDAADKLRDKESYLGKLLKQRDILRDKENQKFKVDFEITQVTGEQDGLTRMNKAFKLILSKPITHCNTCGQKIPANKVKSEKSKVKKEIEANKVKLQEVKFKLRDLNAELGLINEYLEKFKDLKDKISNTEGRIKLERERITYYNEQKTHYNHFRKLRNQYSASLQEIRKEKPKNNVKKHIIKAGKDIKLIKGKLQGLQSISNKLKSRLEITQWLIKDPLSNSGIKAYIFSQMVDIVNEKLLEYGEIINRKITLSVDLESASKDFYITIEQDNNLRFYQDFSGGGQQLINVCIAFAIHDVVCMEKETNVLVLDEIFENLDPSNVELVSTLIQQKSKGRCCHIITHQKDFIPQGANIITLYNKKGITYKAA